MKHHTFLIALLIPPLLTGYTGADEAPNLLKNPGFENSAEGRPAESWHGDAKVYARATESPYQDQACLAFSNADPGHYVLCTQSITLEAGKAYEYGGYVRTQGISGDDSGATFCLQWSDAAGAWLGGAFIGGIKGDKDWTLVEGVSPRIPEEAASFTFSCYVRKGMTGQAWWDAAFVRPHKERPMFSSLVRPHYRGEIFDDGPKTARLHIRLNLIDYPEYTPEKLRIDWRLEKAEVDVPLTTGNLTPQGEEIDLEIPVSELPQGRYQLRLALLAPDRECPLAEVAYPLNRLEAPPEKRTYIDAHQRIIVDGAPFFPLGCYWGAVKPEELARYQESAFNCLMPYHPLEQEAMDACHNAGVKVIYSIKDIYAGLHSCPKSITNCKEEEALIRKRVETYQHHPALLAWYTNDELGLDYISRLEARQHFMETLDPLHPTWAVLYQVDLLDHYTKTCDILGSDPYPIPNNAINIAQEWTQKTQAAVRHARPVWQVPQIFNWANYKKTPEEEARHRPPTLQEMRSMAWQCLAEGAKGLIFYSWFDLHRDKSAPFEERWPEVKELAEEIARFIPMLLSIEAPPAMTAEGADALAWRTFSLEGVPHLLIVNTTRETVSGSFRYSPALGAPESLLDPPENEPAEKGALELTLKPIDIALLRFTK